MSQGGECLRNWLGENVILRSVKSVPEEKLSIPCDVEQEQEPVCPSCEVYCLRDNTAKWHRRLWVYFPDLLIY